MGLFTRLIDFISLGSTRPVRRLLAYYAVLAVVGFLLIRFVPMLNGVLSGERLDQLAKTPAFLQDGFVAGAIAAPTDGFSSRLEFAVSTLFVFLSTLALMLPVTWVYMSAKPGTGHDQSIVQALLVLPMIVAGIVLMVQNSLALAFSLGGVVAAVRFRTNLSDARDVVFIFVAIAVGFAAGVQVPLIALLLSIIFNFVLIAIWRFDFGRSVLEPTAGSVWSGPLDALAGKDAGGRVIPDRDLVLTLTPKKVQSLAERFARLQTVLGPTGKKPRYDGVITVLTTKIADAQRQIELALDETTKRWRLDEVVTHREKPSELFYLIRQRSGVTSDAILTAIRRESNGNIVDASIEVGNAIVKEQVQEKAERKAMERAS